MRAYDVHGATLHWDAGCCRRFEVSRAFGALLPRELQTERRRQSAGLPVPPRFGTSCQNARVGEIRMQGGGMLQRDC
jgi:hypothetical protein